jgi:hypothetical protein
MRRTVQLAMFGLAFLPAAAAAQVCRGFPPLDGNQIGHVGVGASFFDDGKGYGAEATFGGPLFFQGVFNYLDFDNSSLSLKVIGAGVGYEVTDVGSQISLCPGFVASYGFGLEILGVDVTTIQVAPGLSLALTSEVSPTVSVTPFAEGAVVYSRLEADAGPLGENSEDDWSGLLQLGLGVGFNSQLTLRPAVSIPISEEGGNTVFNIMVAIALGG